MSDSALGIEDAATLPTEEIKRDKISAFIVCFNEEADIEDCLKSVSFCDEVLVIDSFSTDRTVEICEAHGARVIQRKWPGYKEQKAFGLAATEHGWVLNLDADERISAELRDNILEVLTASYQEQQQGSTSTSLADGYEVNRLVYYLGRWWFRGGWYPEYRLRFFRKEKVVWGGTDPHEKPIVHGRTARLSGDIYHFTYRKLADQIERLHHFSTIAAQQELNKGGKPSWHRLLINPFLRSFKFYVLKKGYREGKAGFIVAIMEGYYTFMKYAKLWELTVKDHYPTPDEAVRNRNAGR